MSNDSMTSQEAALVAALDTAAPDQESWIAGRNAFYALLQPEPAAVHKTGVEVVEQTVRTQYINLQQWRGMAWILAFVGLLIGGIIALSISGSFFPGQQGVMAITRGVTLLAIPFMGFFVGGWIGSYVEARG